MEASQVVHFVLRGCSIRAESRSSSIYMAMKLKAVEFRDVTLCVRILVQIPFSEPPVIVVL